MTTKTVAPDALTQPAATVTVDSAGVSTVPGTIGYVDMKVANIEAQLERLNAICLEQQRKLISLEERVL